MLGLGRGTDAATRDRGQPNPTVPATQRATPEAAGPLMVGHVTDQRPRRWRSHCDRCKAFIPQGVDAALCDAPRCAYIECFRCFPDPDKELWCPAHRGGVHLETRQGTIAVAPAVPPQTVPSIPDGAAPFLAMVFTAIAVILAATAPSAVPQLERSWRFFLTFLRFINLGLEDVTEWIVCAYLLCRVCPPVNVPLPQFMTRRVLPSTANGDVIALRRRARMSGLATLLEALNGERVLELVRRLTAGVKRRKTNKAPILIHHVRALWDAVIVRTPGWPKIDSSIAVHSASS